MKRIKPYILSNKNKLNTVTTMNHKMSTTNVIGWPFIHKANMEAHVLVNFVLLRVLLIPTEIISLPTDFCASCTLLFFLTMFPNE